MLENYGALTVDDAYCRRQIGHIEACIRVGMRSLPAGAQPAAGYPGAFKMTKIGLPSVRSPTYSCALLELAKLPSGSHSFFWLRVGRVRVFGQTASTFSR